MPPTEGRRLQLTIDADVQRATEDGFRHAGFNGAALILDPRNGEVLDLHEPARPTIPTTLRWASTAPPGRRSTTDKLKPLQNRAAAGPLLARVDLQDRGRDRRRSKKAWSRPTSRCTCTGGANFFGRYFKCHLKGGHGTVDMRHAIEKSCNVYFYTLGNMLGVDKIHKWAEKLGLAGKTGIDLPERAGEHRALDRVEDEAHTARSGTRARRSRCRSGRGRCR